MKVNGERAFADVVNWDHAGEPIAGQQVSLGGGSRERLEAVIDEMRGDGTIVLTVPRFAR